MDLKSEHNPEHSNYGNVTLVTIKTHHSSQLNYSRTSTRYVVLSIILDLSIVCWLKKQRRERV